MEIIEIAGSDSFQVARDIWDPLFAATSPRFALISWKPPPSGHLKVNFDGSLPARGGSVGVAFVIRNHCSRLLAARGCHSFEDSNFGTALRATWEGLLYVRHVLDAGCIILEGDSVLLIKCLRKEGQGEVKHLLLEHIRRMLQKCHVAQVRHVFREANQAADWVVSFVAHHSGDFL
ncbi:uncharacterized protein LOC120111704 [Phoenix dactylifera]|uniref:Uncharacterized protein LOC120111704 n=1 Tax=Phoenix dactylifera TaxID=42345 RepID=A0A8B9AFJ8_PHODC|nr:uncharacterized protein LOC120111704 [Phoenix dactylifera]